MGYVVLPISERTAISPGRMPQKSAENPEGGPLVHASRRHLDVKGGGTRELDILSRCESILQGTNFFSSPM
jgi:hypothetical protein